MDGVSRLRALELYCGGGLVAAGLIAAGLDVVGVDVEPQPNYPGAFIRHDALTLDPRFLDTFPIIWASPPCLKDTVMHASARREEEAHGADETEHPDLIGPTQRMLDAWAARTGGKFTIENVPNTKRLRNPITLCGSMFGLGVTDRGVRFHLERHRKFETNWPLQPPGPCRHVKPVVGIYGEHARNRSARFGGRSTREAWSRPHRDIMAEAMGADPALSAPELSQGIPPAYAGYVAEQLIEHLELERRAA